MKYCIFFFVFLPVLAMAQSVGIGNSTPNPSSILDITSNDKGVLIPRMRTVERLAIPLPVEGLLVFDVNTLSFWVFLGAESGGWTEIGHSKNGIWTKSNDGIFNTSLEGNVGIGTSSPGEMLHIFNNNTSSKIRLTSNNNGNASFSVGLQLAAIGGTTDLSRGNNTPGATTAGISSQKLTRLFSAGGPVLIGNSDNSPLYLATNNTVKATLTGNGRMGIGTTAPSGILSLNHEILGPDIGFSIQDVEYGSLRLTNGLLNDMVLSTSGNNETGRIRLTAGSTQFKVSPQGTVTIGPSAMVGPYTLLISDSDKDPMIQFQKGATNKGFIQIVDDNIKIGTNVDNDLGNFFIKTNGSDRVIVNKDGNMGVGTLSPTVKFQVGVNGDGTVAKANAWQTFSDERFKKDIIPINDAVEKIKHLQGYYYHWKSGSDNTRQAGFLAQEVEKVLPEIVSTDSEGYKSVDYGKMNALLLQALKEQQQLVKNLEKRVSDLEKK